MFVPETVPAGVLFTKVELNAVLPPLLTEPETIRSALSLCVVDFVQPVGAAVCTNNITVPEGMSNPDCTLAKVTALSTMSAVSIEFAEILTVVIALFAILLVLILCVGIILLS